MLLLNNFGSIFIIGVSTGPGLEKIFELLYPAFYAFSRVYDKYLSTYGFYFNN